ncbi:Uncharacterised protein [Mycobacteroides abscessus subsp. abscessus]|nr:Uncharacterised protein [Mycobacteroides abscessus subsp. abscessus]
MLYSIRPAASLTIVIFDRSHDFLLIPFGQ